MGKTVRPTDSEGGDLPIPIRPPAGQDRRDTKSRAAGPIGAVIAAAVVTGGLMATGGAPKMYAQSRLESTVRRAETPAEEQAPVLMAQATASPVQTSAPASQKLEFDVASIEVSRIDRGGRGGGGGRDVFSFSIDGPPLHPPRNLPVGGPGTSDPGRYSFPQASMLSLLGIAYGLGPDHIEGGAKCCSDRPDVVYDVQATMPPETTQDQFRIMMQNLLAERFHLVMHHETRNFPGYELAVDKGGAKLKEDPPSAGASGPEYPAAGSRINFSGRQGNGTGTIKMHGGTMADLINQLLSALTISQTAGDDTAAVRPRIADRTGLAGRYTFDVEFTTPGSGLGTAPDADVQPDLYIALRERLGLRLSKTPDIPEDVIVVDSVDTLPTAN